MLTSNLEEGVIILDCLKYQVVYANRAADRFLVVHDQTFHLLMTFDNGKNQEVFNTD